jgi:hypothetical protein
MRGVLRAASSHDVSVRELNAHKNARVFVALDGIVGLADQAQQF